MGSKRKKVTSEQLREAHAAAAVEFLRTLTPPELAQVLRRVLANNPPSHGQVECDRGILYLGYAWSSWASAPSKGIEAVWGEWQRGAVAYNRSDELASSLDGALHRETHCPECHTHLWSNDKLMICPVCGWDAVKELEWARRTQPPA